MFDMFLCTILSFLLVSMSDATNLDELKHFEVVELRDISFGLRSKRSTSNKAELGLIADDAAFQVRSTKRDFVLRLEKNNVLVPGNFKTYTYGFDGLAEYKVLANCYYHGYIDGQPNSSAVLSTCFGLEGMIRDDTGEEYYLEPAKGAFPGNASEATHVLFKLRDLSPGRKMKTCGLNHSHVDVIEFTEHERDLASLLQNIREKRAVPTVEDQTKYNEVVVVADFKLFQRFGSNVARTQDRVMAIMNHVDMVFKAMNTRVAVMRVIVMTALNVGFRVSVSAGETLGSFQQWCKTKLHLELKLGHDNAQLISGEDFTGSVAGLAPIGELCSYTSAAVSEDHSSNAKVSANTVAHEMGHNFGLFHDGGSCHCPKEPCVMAAVAPGAPVQSFTDCSLKNYNERLRKGQFPCLFDYPDQLFGPVTCGNQYVQAGEECDCGTPEECAASGEDRCCDPLTCRLKPGAKCAHGLCCNIKACSLHKQGTLCRDKQSSCDLAEYCNGTSNLCPRNYFLSDGTSCDGNQAYCYSGACKSHTSQCKVLFGPNAVTANDICYERMNSAGDDFGNCGKNADGSWIKCSREDVFCGKVLCGGNDVPDLAIVGNSRSAKTLFFGSVKCKSATVEMSPDLDDPTVAAPGTKCATDKVCYKSKCVKLSEISEVFNCTGRCFNGGVCNNVGSCHCPPGFACPDCRFAGMGGSKESGQGCSTQTDCGCLTPLVKILLIVFLLIVPLLLLISWLVWRDREKIRERFRSCRIKWNMGQGGKSKFKSPSRDQRNNVDVHVTFKQPGSGSPRVHKNQPKRTVTAESGEKEQGKVHSFKPAPSQPVDRLKPYAARKMPPPVAASSPEPVSVCSTRPTTGRNADAKSGRGLTQWPPPQNNISSSKRTAPPPPKSALNR